MPPAQSPLSDTFAQQIVEAVAEYGENVVRWSWDSFFKAFLPLAAVLHAEQELISEARSRGLDRPQTLDAMSLMSSLMRTEDPHKAWLAAEIIARVTSVEGVRNLCAALTPGPKDKSELS